MCEKSVELFIDEYTEPLTSYNNKAFDIELW